MEYHPWVDSERKFYEKMFNMVTKYIDFKNYSYILDYGT